MPTEKRIRELVETMLKWRGYFHDPASCTEDICGALDDKREVIAETFCIHFNRLFTELGDDIRRYLIRYEQYGPEQPVAASGVELDRRAIVACTKYKFPLPHKLDRQLIDAFRDLDQAKRPPLLKPRRQPLYQTRTYLQALALRHVAYFTGLCGKRRDAMCHVALAYGVDEGTLDTWRSRLRDTRGFPNLQGHLDHCELQGRGEKDMAAGGEPVKLWPDSYGNAALERDARLYRKDLTAKALSGVRRDPDDPG